MAKLRFGMFGAGFWSHYQLAGWMETCEVECVAICDPVQMKAQALADKFGVGAVYTEPEALLRNERVDFIDICTPVETHFALTQLVAQHGRSVVCQKPMATTLRECEALVATCKAAGVPLFINENWRWQHPIRHFKARLDTGNIGRVFRTRLEFRNSFAVFDNQPFLKELEEFILTDVGSHVLDVARFLFGEATTLYAHTARIHTDIRGEDVATVMMTMGDGATVICELSYATRREHDRFPETYIEVEGEHGFLELAPDYWIRETTKDGTLANRYVPSRYVWADPAYDLVHSSIVPCQINIARALKGAEPGETTGEDNLKTMRLIFSAYESARNGQVLKIIDKV